MIFPQTEALNWSKVFPESKKLNAIANYGCLAMCYLYCIGIEPSNIPEYLKYLTDAMDTNLLDDECTVLNANKFLEAFSRKKFNVIKKDITTIKDIKDKTPVRFDNNGFSHWVVVENGKIVFNSLINSVCVTCGKPTTARILIQK